MEPFYSYFFGYLPKKTKDFIRALLYIILLIIVLEIGLKLFLFIIIVGIISRIVKYLYFLTK
ncbi:MAG: hypothetical protein CMC72_00510 [Flavobacteriaceae bacterium]|nr:hypothetical protein [Flavobacteriaceae bacterium]